MAIDTKIGKGIATGSGMGIGQGILQGAGLLADPNAGAEYAERALAIQEEIVEMAKSVPGINMDEVESYIRQAGAEIPKLVGLLQAVELGPSAFEQIRTDPELEKVQKLGIQRLQEVAEGGLSDEDRARFRDLRQAATAEEQARQRSIMRSMEERGMGGSGAELAARLGSSQAEAQRAAQQGRQMGQMAQQGRLSAAQAMAQQAGQLRGQQFQEKSAVAQAKDVRDQFAGMNRQNIAAQNLAARQAAENQRSGIQRGMHQSLAGLEPMRFQSEMSRVGAISGAMGNLAQGLMGRAQAQAHGAQQQAAGMRGLVGAAGKAAAGAGADGGVKYKNGGTKKKKSDSKVDKLIDLLSDLHASGKKYENGSEEFSLLRPKEEDMEIKPPSNNQLLADVTPPQAPQAEIPYALGMEPKPVVKERKPDLVGKPIDIKGELPGEEKKKKPLDFDYKEETIKAPEAMDINPNDLRKPVKDLEMPEMDWQDGGVDQGEVFRFDDGGMKEMSLEALGETDPVEAFGSEDMSDDEEDMRGMNHEAEGEGAIIESGEENQAGDELPDRINDDEMVLNVKQQDELVSKLLRLKQLEGILAGVEPDQHRVDDKLENGQLDVDRDQQEGLMRVARGEMDVSDLEDKPLIKSRLADLGARLGKKGKRNV